MENRTYRYFTGDPLCPFGYGLSYTTFKYSKFKVKKKYSGSDTIDVSVVVKNTGKTGGDEVVQVYLSNLSSPFPVPIRSLKAFKRIHLLPGEIMKVTFSIVPDSFLVIADKNEGFDNEKSCNCHQDLFPYTLLSVEQVSYATWRI